MKAFLILMKLFSTLPAAHNCLLLFLYCCVCVLVEHKGILLDHHQQQKQTSILMQDICMFNICIFMECEAARTMPTATEA